MSEIMQKEKNMIRKFLVQIQQNENLLVEHHVKVKCNSEMHGKAILKNVFRDYDIVRMEEEHENIASVL